MAVTLTTAARNAACNAIVDLIDDGTTDANGDLVIRTSGDVEVATLAFSNPAFDAAATGTANAGQTGFEISDDTGATGGTAANFIFQDRDNVKILEGSAGDGGTEDLVLSSASIGSGDTVSVTSFEVTVPAS